jgi:hypothetical protein
MMEETLSEDEEGPLLRLKTGEEVNARPAYIIWTMFLVAQSKEPEELKLMVALARGIDLEIAPAIHSEAIYRNPLLFGPDRKMTAVARQVMLSAFRETPDGDVLVNPFQLATEKENDIFNDVETQAVERIRRLGRREGPERPSRS